MRVQVVDHPLVAHKLSKLRDQATDTPTFRLLTDELVTLLAYEATRDLPVLACPVTTPISITTGVELEPPHPVVVPVLRAGLGMLAGMVRLVPTAQVGFLGMARDEETLRVTTYADRLPDDLAGRHCFLLDPMLATGATLVEAVRYLDRLGAASVTAVCLLAAPEGLANLEQTLGVDHALTVVTAAVDEKLDHHGYIVPGLGDAGDRLYGAVA